MTATPRQWLSLGGNGARLRRWARAGRGRRRRGGRPPVLGIRVVAASPIARGGGAGRGGRRRGEESVPPCGRVFEASVSFSAININIEQRDYDYEVSDGELSSPRGLPRLAHILAGLKDRTRAT
eukprot:scaffold272266_cov30-Tisochrysis_lutea.AAC.2